MITVGASAYSRVIDFARMGEIARASGALLFADVAHIAGLIVTGHHPSPFPHADFVTTTTHKTLRGPRGGLILCRAAHAKAVDSAVFPGAQGGPLMHVIAAKAVCFAECMKPEFKAYSGQIIRNSRALAAAMASRGYRVVSGGTDNHLFLADLRPTLPELTAKRAQETLDLAHITCNKNTVPFETRSPVPGLGHQARDPGGHDPRDARAGDGRDCRADRHGASRDRDARRGRGGRRGQGPRREADRPIPPALPDVALPP